MSVHLRGLASWVRPAAEYAVELAREWGLEVQVTSVYRSWSEQDRLRRRFEQCVAQGRYPAKPPDPCAYPANQPGDSAHNWGMAFDSVPSFQDDSWRRFWASYGFHDAMSAWTAIRRWIGFKVFDHDPPHAEVPGWRDYAPSNRLDPGQWLGS